MGCSSISAKNFDPELFIYNRRAKKDFELILKNICMEQGYKIHAIEIVTDHVHLFLEFHPSTSLSKVLQYLKGGSSHRLFKLHPELKKRYWGGSLWSSGKFFRSVGNVTADTIEHYNQGISGETESRVPIMRIRGIRATKTRRFLDSIKPGVRACGPAAYPIL